MRCLLGGKTGSGGGEIDGNVAAAGIDGRR